MLHPLGVLFYENRDGNGSWGLFLLEFLVLEIKLSGQLHCVIPVAEITKAGNDIARSC